jgi:hypothetical protein
VSREKSLGRETELDICEFVISKAILDLFPNKCIRPEGSSTGRLNILLYSYARERGLGVGGGGRRIFYTGFVLTIRNI